MYLAADIGGTKTHVAIYKGGNYAPVTEKKYVSKDYDNIITILNDFLLGAKQKVDKICLGIAGPVKNGVCKTTNLPWVVDASEVAKAMGVEKVGLINDLEANAYGIKTLEDKDFHVLHKGDSTKGNQALISAGTGLGEAGIVWVNGEHVPFACEGGHSDFAPRDDLEIELLHYLMGKYGSHISYERILCGKGIHELYCFLTETKRQISCFDVDERLKKEDPPKVISEAGVSGACIASVKALELFCSIYGSEAGNCALKYMAYGGIYIGGGIAPKILDVLVTSSFVSSFINKGRMKDLLQKIPIKVVLNEKTALRGSAYYCNKIL